MTLADMLSNANIIYFKGHRVRCANPITVANTVFKGELLLVDMYNEKYLLGYAFTGGTGFPKFVFKDLKIRTFFNVLMIIGDDVFISHDKYQNKSSV
jgi:hypothetical protein